MALTRSRLLEMRESELRKDVLIPLFKAMGYRDVYDYPGSGEKGKDIVMWAPTLVGYREKLRGGREGGADHR